MLKILFNSYKEVDRIYTWEYTKGASAVGLYDVEKICVVVICHEEVDDNSGPGGELRMRSSNSLMFINKSTLDVVKNNTESFKNEDELLAKVIQNYPGSEPKKVSSLLLNKGRACVGRVYIADGDLVLNDFLGEKVEINFGRSDWACARKDPSAIPEDTIVVPIVGTLPKKDQVRAGQFSTLSPQQVWVPERGEWVSIVCESWQEGGWEDRNIHGPFVLDEKDVENILRDYKVAIAEPSISVVKRLSPEQLKELSQKSAS